MEVIVGIDLGTTNSEISYIRENQPYVIPDATGDPILPSVVGLADDGRLLVGHAARNQWLLAPELTVKSIKRRMGRTPKCVWATRNTPRRRSRRSSCVPCASGRCNTLAATSA